MAEGGTPNILKIVQQPEFAHIIFCSLTNKEVCSLSESNKAMNYAFSKWFGGDLEAEEQAELDQMFEEEETHAARDMLFTLLHSTACGRFRDLLMDGGADGGELEEVMRAFEESLIRGAADTRDAYWNIATSFRDGVSPVTVGEVSADADAPYIHRVMRRLFASLDAESRSVGAAAATRVAARKLEKVSAKTARAESVLKQKKMSPDLAYKAMQAALVAQEGLTPQAAADLLQPLKLAAGTLRTSSPHFLQGARDLAQELLGDAGRFPDIDSTIGVRDFASTTQKIGIGYAATHFPVSDQHMAGGKADRFIEPGVRSTPAYRHYYPDHPEKCFNTESVCCSYFHMEAAIEFANWQNVSIIDLFPVTGHPRKGGIDMANPAHMQIVSAQLADVLAEGGQWLRTYSHTGTLVTIALLEERQLPSGKSYDVDVDVHGKTVRVHLFTDVVLKVEESAKSVTGPVGLLGSQHISLRRVPFLCVAMLAADSLFSGLIGLTLDSSNFDTGAIQSKGSGLSEKESYEAYQMFLAEEHSMIQAFMLSLMMNNSYTLEQAMQCVISRRSVANGVRMKDAAAAEGVVERCMEREDRPEGLVFEARGRDVVAFSVRVSRTTEEESSVKEYATGQGANTAADNGVLRRLRRGDGGYAATIFTGLEQEGVSLTHSTQNERRKTKEEEEAKKKATAAIEKEKAISNGDPTSIAVAKKVVKKSVAKPKTKKPEPNKPEPKWKGKDVTLSEELQEKGFAVDVAVKYCYKIHQGGPFGYRDCFVGRITSIEEEGSRKRMCKLIGIYFNRLPGDKYEAFNITDLAKYSLNQELLVPALDVVRRGSVLE